VVGVLSLALAAHADTSTPARAGAGLVRLSRVIRQGWPDPTGSIVFEAAGGTALPKLDARCAILGVGRRYADAMVVEAYPPNWVRLRLLAAALGLADEVLAVAICPAERVSPRASIVLANGSRGPVPSAGKYVRGFDLDGDRAPEMVEYHRDCRQEDAAHARTCLGVTELWVRTAERWARTEYVVGDGGE
jgi:hypothetical protein